MESLVLIFRASMRVSMNKAYSKNQLNKTQNNSSGRTGTMKVRVRRSRSQEKDLFSSKYIPEVQTKFWKTNIAVRIVLGLAKQLKTMAPTTNSSETETVCASGTQEFPGMTLQSTNRQLSFILRESVSARISRDDTHEKCRWVGLEERVLRVLVRLVFIRLAIHLPESFSNHFIKERKYIIAMSFIPFTFFFSLSFSHNVGFHILNRQNSPFQHFHKKQNLNKF